MKQETKQILIGAGIGVAVAIPTTFLVTKSVVKKNTVKRCREATEEDRRTAFKHGHKKGYDEAIEKAKVWVDDFKKQMEENVIFVNPDDPEGALKAIQSASKSGDAQYEAKNDAQPVSDANSVAEKLADIKRAYTKEEIEPKNEIEENKIESTDAIFESPKGPEEPKTTSKFRKRYGLNSDGTVTVQSGINCYIYPGNIFYDKDGYNLGETQIRANLMDYEKNPAKLKDVWEAMGWGEYYPDPTLKQISQEELKEMEEKSEEEYQGSDAEDVSLERQRYLDSMERYIANPEAAPRIVPRKRFEEDHYLDHIYVDFYDVDNIFVENTDFENEIDAYTMFGVADGKDLFRYKHDHPFDEDEDDNDPDIVHVENFKMNVIAEITRYHKSFASVKDGSAYLDGNST